MEIRQVHGFPFHFADSDGHVYVQRNAKRPLRRLAENASKRTGYLAIKMGNTRVSVHRLVALAFHGPRPEGMQIRHLNGIQDDNRPSNLRYGTPRENRADTERHGRIPRGAANGQTRYEDSVVRQAVAAHYVDGREVATIARELGLGEEIVRSWVKGRCRSWAHDFQTPYGRLVYGRRVSA